VARRLATRFRQKVCMQYTFQAWREQAQLRRLEQRGYAGKSCQGFLKPWLLLSDPSCSTVSAQVAATQHPSALLSDSPSFSSLDDEGCKDHIRREHCDVAEKHPRTCLSASNAAEALSKAEAHIRTLEGRVRSSPLLLMAPHGPSWYGFALSLAMM
jgi:hypothetical protein